MMDIYIEFDEECLDIDIDIPSPIIIEEEECVKLDIEIEDEGCIP